MYNLINKLFCSPTCDEQDKLMQLQASYVSGWFSTKSNQIHQREVIVSWLQSKGCDIEMNGQNEYTLNGQSFPWCDVSPINKCLGD